MPINEFITNEMFSVFLVFCRIGTCLMLLPGFGDSYVPAQVRLLFGLVLSLALAHAIPALPKLPASATMTLFLILHEVIIGLLIGGIIKIMTAAVHVGGTIIAAQSSLGQASLFDPSQQSQGAVFGTFMQMLALALIFALDFHHLIISGLVSSYDVFTVEGPMAWADFSALATKTVSESFAVGVQIASPLIVVGILINLTSGILARLMPAFQVFFVILPLQILVSLFIFMATLSTMMLVYMDYLNENLASIFPL